ncbi:MAG: hypothetical protein WDA53_03145 [Bacillota bacterium]
MLSAFSRYDRQELLIVVENRLDAKLTAWFKLASWGVGPGSTKVVPGVNGKEKANGWH